MAFRASASQQRVLPGVADKLNEGGRETLGYGRRWWQVLKIAISDWQEDKATQLAAALAYYTIFSIAPLLIVMLAVTGALLEEKAVTGHLYQELRGYLGEDSAAFVQDMVARAGQRGGGSFASVVSIGVLLYGASAVFKQLKEAVNTIWQVGPAQSTSWWQTARSYLVSFSMVLSVGFLLLVSLVIHSVLAAASEWIEDSVHGYFSFAYAMELVAALLVTTLLFALMLKYLPNCHVAWRHVWLGALVTAVLFSVGKFLFGLYLSRGTIGSTYGAAGSVIVILLWAYYSSLIFLFGVEFTQAHARVFGKNIDDGGVADRREVQGRYKQATEEAKQKAQKESKSQPK